ncbi:alpha/beta hydrolase [Aeromicrobium wangtongii]|uniref:Alpha/beta hydrolase n=1 Tax=Aeromicrobium wangtongii TaxID=2969247 RepID=A0ABY5M6G2_9ACTN|nr:alpha/beta fold hydrolase [Aeromicrobium wangtongii]MCD9199222.1 alpha/beta hydrolase [Aeromicrobium wangtongii]UUP12751.1 alpha/beta hydrolase [Aeromicrobium wangtongii]
MTNSPRLIAVSEPRHAEAVVLVLHGGASRRDNPMVSPTQLSVLRMIPVAKRIARADPRRLAVYRLLNSTRGWDASHTPVDDVHWAIDQLHEGFGSGLPVGLVGHSLGGRAAILAARRPEVSSLVALNPWVYPADGAVDLTGRRVLIVHGTDDRIASPANAAAAARGLGQTADVSFVRVAGAKHAMLRRGREFERLAADFCAATLLGDRTPRGVVAKALAGESPIDI